LYEEDRKAWGPIMESRGDHGSEKQDKAEQAFLHQLEHDPLYAQGKPDIESEAWARIQLVLEELDWERESLTCDGLPIISQEPTDHETESVIYF